MERGTHPVSQYKISASVYMGIPVTILAPSSLIFVPELKKMLHRGCPIAHMNIQVKGWALDEYLHS